MKRIRNQKHGGLQAPRVSCIKKKSNRLHPNTNALYTATVLNTRTIFD